MKKYFFGSFFQTFTLVAGLLVLLFIVSGVLNKPVTYSRASVIDDTPVEQNVLLLVFNPYIDSNRTQKLVNYKSWYDPDHLTESIVDSFPQVSHNYLTYNITERIEINDFFKLSDGFVYTHETYEQCLANTSTCHQPYYINYKDIFDTFDVCSKNVDEVWMWGGPYFGYFEYNPVNYCGKTQFVMGFSYERGLGEAVHDFGHRMEFVANNRVGDGNWQQNEINDWNKFSLIDGHCGNIHYPPGNIIGQEEYVYDRQSYRDTDCNGYKNYPEGPYIKESLNCTAWECTQSGYVKWWLGNIPANSGTNNLRGKTVYNNWWKYYVFYDESAGSFPSPTPTLGTFTNLWSVMSVPGDAVFGFEYSGTPSQYVVDVSIYSDMSWGTYLTFAQGSSSPVIDFIPEKWDQYVCGKKLYWTVKTAYGATSPIQTSEVRCNPDNNLPFFKTDDLPTAHVGKKYNTQIIADDNDIGDIVHMTVSGLPKGIKSESCELFKNTSRDQIKCSVYGTSEEKGSNNVLVKLFDSYGGVAEKNFEIIVK